EQFFHLPPGIQAIQNGHGDIDHDHVRLQFAGCTHQSTAIADHSDYIKFGFEKSLAQFRHQIVIIGDQNTRTVRHWRTPSLNIPSEHNNSVKTSHQEIVTRDWAHKSHRWSHFRKASCPS